MEPQPSLQPPAAPGAAKTSGLAIAALIIGVPGMCFFPLGAIAVILAIVALVQMSKDPRLGGKALAIVGLVLSLVGIPIQGILAAIAIPNFIRFQARAKQSECKSNLKALYTAQQAYRAEHDLYSLDIAKLGWEPERGNRYAYFLSPRGVLQDRSESAAGSVEDAAGIQVDTFKYRTARPLALSDLRAPLAGGVSPGLTGTCPECSFTAVCIGNIDSDDTLDVWSISSEGRVARGKVEAIGPGEPHNDVNDVRD